MMNIDKDLETLRTSIREHYLADEADVVKKLITSIDLTAQERLQISEQAQKLVNAVRTTSSPTLMENFLGEYGLSTKEGIALMCLAEALLRVPDTETIDALIEDKLIAGHWNRHLGHSSSSLVNASTWALMLTGKMLSATEESGLMNTFHELIRKLGEPVVRTAVAQAMHELGRQFVHGRTIEEAIDNAQPLEKQGYSYSYDMLGEAARTDADTRQYHLSYANTISELAPVCHGGNVSINPGVSVKLSALHARFEYTQRERVLRELVPRVRSLALLAKSTNMGFNIDAEEADRLDLSLDVIEAVLSDLSLAGWDGFGVVVQAYGQRAMPMIDWLHALAVKFDTRLMVRLVKGAYWDSEIKRSQMLGLSGYPVFTRKANTDVSYIACAKKLLGMTDRIFPQFATHNAHSIACILHMAADLDSFEFQRLHGMGESLFQIVHSENKARCRIYAPVGAHKDLLAYLVRRLLENGANSSFVNQIVNKNISDEMIARDPVLTTEAFGKQIYNNNIPKPAHIFANERINSRGWDITDPITINSIFSERNRFQDHYWRASPLIDGNTSNEEILKIKNPAKPNDTVGEVIYACESDIEKAISSARKGLNEWSSLPVSERAELLKRSGDLYESHACELFALLTREAGKTLTDCIGELREAVDFSRYYAKQAIMLDDSRMACGVFACISPWNFPLAIFSGQIFAALAAGNSVLAKPAEQTPLIAARAVSLMHQAGIPKSVLQLLPGDGETTGAALTASSDIDGVCFTGSLQTAQSINRSMANALAPNAPLIAETGGLNAMIIDSTALPEQAVHDILVSAFQSAGQRCSALRILYVQSDVYDRFVQMLTGAMDELQTGDPWELASDVGPVIDDEAFAAINDYCIRHIADGRLIKRLQAPVDGLYVALTVLRVDGIEELDEEVFGPVLHLASFQENELDSVIDAINAKGYGLTFGLHTRLDSRIQYLADRIKAGNLYVNRNQIGAVVGSQPFGGESLSGTGPKAGGPLYLRRFTRSSQETNRIGKSDSVDNKKADHQKIQAAIDALDQTAWREMLDRQSVMQKVFTSDAHKFAHHLAAIDKSRLSDAEMPGPTGEDNLYKVLARGKVICTGPSPDEAISQAIQALYAGNGVVLVCVNADSIANGWKDAGLPVHTVDGILTASELTHLHGFDVLASNADHDSLRSYHQSLARREGAIIPLISETDTPERYYIERHLCINTTASGGNASLMISTES